MNINWQYAGHTAVGVVITACQAIALADPDPKIVSYCHIITLVAIQLGISFGVWQAGQLMGAKRDNVDLTSRLAIHEAAKPSIMISGLKIEGGVAAAIGEAKKDEEPQKA